jgi:hypothetical protein
MSLGVHCVVCDTRIDPYGRDGATCARCQQPCSTCGGAVQNCSHKLVELADQPRIERFWSRVDRRSNDECWRWTAALDGKGYGRFRLPAGNKLAHRIAWELHNGTAVPKGMFVCHSCDNPVCVNPAHLWLGTVHDNIRDRTEKGRTSNGNVGKTACSRGHQLTEENTYRRPDTGNRDCKICRKLRRKQRQPRSADILTLEPKHVGDGRWQVAA